MAEIRVTPELLQSTATDMDEWLRQLREAADCMKEWQPEGFVYRKAPAISDKLRGIVEFTSTVRGQAEAAKLEKKWGVSAKTKRRTKK